MRKAHIPQNPTTALCGRAYKSEPRSQEEYAETLRHYHYEIRENRADLVCADCLKRGRNRIA